MQLNRRDLMKTAGIASGITLFGAGNAAASPSNGSESRAGKHVEVSVKQPANKRTHWVLPGKRRLDPDLFGTPPDGFSTPQLGGAHIKHKIATLSRAGNPTAGLLKGGGDYDPFPVPVGWPESLRETNDDGTKYTKTANPLPFGDKAVGSNQNSYVNGGLNLTYIDRQGFKGDGEGGDEIDFDVWFTDPAGNKYEIDVEHLETHDGAHPHGRGVMTGAYLHGSTGIGTPLMPTAYTFGSFWGVGDVSINGQEPVEQNTHRLIHFMTTQNVRKHDYTLAFDADLPLGTDGYLDHPTHTHGILPPVRFTEDGPRKVPLQSAFELPNGMKQPFAHFMWDEDEVDLEVNYEDVSLSEVLEAFESGN